MISSGVTEQQGGSSGRECAQTGSQLALGCSGMLQPFALCSLLGEKGVYVPVPIQTI